MSPGGAAGEILSALTGLALLGAMGLPGVAVLRSCRCNLSPLERAAYGFPLGLVATSLALVAVASLVGTLSLELVGLSGLLSLVTGTAIWHHTGHPGAEHLPNPVTLGRIGILVIALVTVRWAMYWHSALVLAPDGLWAGSVNLWGDWSQHLGDVTAFAYGDNFPPTNPRLSGQPLAYHYLSSVTVAAMVRLGLDPVRALPLHSGVVSFFVALGIYAFARRLTGSERAGALALILFILGGGLGWWFQLAKFVHHQADQPDVLRLVWDPELQAVSNMQWKNMFFALLGPQRGMLYGFPLGLLSLTLLFIGTETGRIREFVLAGITAGLLPFAHLGTLLALALVTPVLWVLFPRRQWVVFFLIWAIIGLPQVWLQQGGGPGAAGAMRVQLGWVASPDPWIWFWLKNIGFFAPLTVIALLLGGTATPRAGRFLTGLMPTFVIANVLVFQPWDWDNTKVLAYWFLACCILVSGLLVRLWDGGGVWTRAVTVALLGTMLLSGLLENLVQALGGDRHQILSAEEVRVAIEARARTEPRALFAVGLRHNHPITVLAGRRVVLGFPGWMWSQGLSYQEQERALEDIFALTSDAPDLLRKYGVDYVVIGPDERQRFAADLHGYRSHFPTLLRTENYEIFAVRSQHHSGSR